MACPKCGSRNTEILNRIDLVDSLPEGDITVVEVACLDCAELFTVERFESKPQQEVLS